MAKALNHFKVGRGDFVVLAPLNLPESFFAIMGVIAVGAVPVPINVRLLKEPGQKDFLHILHDCRPKFVLSNYHLSAYLKGIKHKTFEGLLLGGSFLEKSIQAQDIFESRDPDTLLIMPYTSGTTGNPKGVMLSVKNISDRVTAIIKELEITHQERVFSYLPLGHISELVASLFGQLAGRYTVYFSEYSADIIENQERFRAAFPEILRAVQPTVFLAAPKVWTNIRERIERKTRYFPVNLEKHGLIRDYIIKKIKEHLGFEQTRIFISAGSKLSRKDTEFFTKLGICIDDIYGQTETAGPLTLNGKVIGDTSITAGENDEILVSGSCVMKGYFQSPEATAKAIDEFSIYHTGDIGLWKADKVFWGGRVNDKFKNAQGEFVSPEKIEKLEEMVREIKSVDEVIICAENRPYNVALVFSSTPSKKLRREIEIKIKNIGYGMYRIGNFLLINSDKLELTPGTMKVRRRATIKKFGKEIDKL